MLLNGIPGTEFKCRHGVRQGDPLSPLLFVLAANLLQSLINKSWTEGHINLPIDQPASKNFPVIQYADDIILLLLGRSNELRTIKMILDSYVKATGLKINYVKSQLMPINVTEEKVNELAQVLGCQVGTMPFTYLGLPLGTSRPTMRELMPLFYYWDGDLVILWGKSSTH